MRAYELMKETFLRRSYIWIAHLIWLALYGLFWWLFYPDGSQMGGFIFTWGGLPPGVGAQRGHLRGRHRLGAASVFWSPSPSGPASSTSIACSVSLSRRPPTCCWPGH